jgi:DNA-binding response OmpR family regulator
LRRRAQRAKIRRLMSLTPPPRTRVFGALIVDDDPASSRSLALQLEHLGWDVREAATVADARAALARGPADLVVSDSTMPDGDGAGFLARVMAEHPATVRVFYSGLPTSDAAREAIAHGVASRHFVKGQDLAGLLRLAKELATAPVSQAATQSIRLRWRDQRVVLVAGAWTIGRSMTTHIKVPDSQMSREHARLHVVADGVWLEDRASLNGAYVNGTRIAAPVLVRAGDRFRLGVTEFALEDADPQIKLGGSAVGSVAPAAAPGDVPDTWSDEPTVVPEPPRRISRPVSAIGSSASFVDREALENASRTPTGPRAVPNAGTVLAVLRDRIWAEQIVRAAAIHRDLRIELALPADALLKLQWLPASCLLLLDVDAVGNRRGALLAEWRSAPGRGPVLLVGSVPETAGAALAAELGAAAYVRSGLSPILVVGAIRMQIDRGHAAT